MTSWKRNLNNNIIQMTLKNKTLQNQLMADTSNNKPFLAFASWLFGMFKNIRNTLWPASNQGLPSLNRSKLYRPPFKNVGHLGTEWLVHRIWCEKSWDQIPPPHSANRLVPEGVRSSSSEWWHTDTLGSVVAISLGVSCSGCTTES